mmetsp:Transcript_19704/g.41195  ORF Transcript_19704/g.41195 Transcript_19704/m.41195 type:complete len:241 (-) Transcript_19704:52-774(-)
MAALVHAPITETPLGFTSNLLDTLSHARSSLDAFVSHHKSVLDSVASAGQASIEKYTEELTRLNERLNEVEGQDGEMKKLNNQKMEEVTRKEAEIAALEEKVTREGGDRISALKSEEETARALAESCRAAREKSELSKSKTVDLLTKSIVSYREGLGLEFERAAGNKLRLVFTSLDPNDHSRAFAFTVNVNESEEYEIQECMPKLDDLVLSEMVNNVNQTNDFGGFVRGVRNAFKEQIDA